MRLWWTLFVAACSSNAPAPAQPIAQHVPADAALEAPPDAPPDAADPADGERLYAIKGCIACHSVDGSLRVGPTFRGLWGTTIQLSDGSQVVADENYVRESLFDPTAKGRAGFSPVMPSYRGQLTDADVDALLVFLKSVR